MSAVSKRYAEALLEAGKNNQNKYQEYLKELENLYLNNEEFKTIINTPAISEEDKLNILKEFPFKDEVFWNFIELIIKEKRLNLIADISQKYTELIDKLNGKLNIEIITSSQLPEEELNKIALKYQKIENAKEVNYRTKIDKSLIGGVKVIANGKIYDDTIKTKLTEML